MEDATSLVATTAPRSRLAGLDGLRGLAACAVAFGFHGQFLFAPDVVAHGWGGPPGFWVHRHAWTFVDLFFVLSGYVFAHVYPYGESLRQPGGMRQFGLARFARLYPLHLATLLLTATMFWSLDTNTAGAFVAHLTMLQAFVAPAGHTFNGPVWSLSIEAVCYLLFALSARAGGRTLLWFSWLAVGAGAVGVVIGGSGGEIGMATNLARGLLGFFTGQLLWRYQGKLARVPTFALASLVILGFALTLWTNSALVPLSLLAWPSVTLLGLRLRQLGSLPLLWLGDRSYAIYLLHMPMIELIAFSTGGLRGDPGSIIAGQLGLMVFVLFASDFVYRRFEVPARRAIVAWGQPSRQLRLAAMPD